MEKAPEKEAIPGRAEAEVKGGLSLRTSLSRQNRQTSRWLPYSLAFRYTKRKGDGSDLEAPTTLRPQAESLLSARHANFGSVQTRAADHMVPGRAASWVLVVDT